MRLRSLICWLLIACQAFGEIKFSADSGGGATAWYVRFQTAPTTFKAFQLSEGTSGGLGVYAIDDAALVSGGMTSTDGEYPFTIRPGTASDTADNNPVMSGVMGWTGVAERPLLTLTPLRRVIFVQSTGSDSNNGLNRLKPKATISAAHTASRAGDCIYLIGANVGNISSGKRLEWDGDSNAVWTQAAAGVNLQVQSGGGADGSSIRHIKFVQSLATHGQTGPALQIEANNVTLEDFSATSTGAVCIQFQACDGLKMNRVTASGWNRGFSNLGADVTSRGCWGYGNEAPFYMDSNDSDGDAWWDSEDDKMFRYSAADELVSNTNNVPQASGFFSESHSEGYMSHIHIRRPWYDVQVLNPAYISTPTAGSIPVTVSFVYIWTDTSASVPIPVDLTIEGGGGYLKNLAAGPTQHIHGSAGTKGHVNNFAHDPSTNSGGDITVTFDNVKKIKTLTDLLITMLESSGGHERFKANAVELSPSGSGLTQQQTRDSMKLAPSAGAPAAESVDGKIDKTYKAARTK